MFKNRIPKTNIIKEKWYNFISKYWIHIAEMITLYRSSRFTSTLLNKNKSPSHLQDIVILIYFTRKDIRFIVEKWELRVIEKEKNFQNSDSYFNMIKINKKLLTLQKTVEVLLKMLPVYSLFKKRNFDFEFEIEILSDFSQNNEIFSKNLNNIIFNQISDNFANISLTINYVNQIEIFNIEENLKQIDLQKQNEIRQSYYLSVINSNNPGEKMSLIENCPHPIERKFSLSNSDINNKGNHLNSFSMNISEILTPEKGETQLAMERNEIQKILTKYNNINTISSAYRFDTEEDSNENSNNDLLSENFDDEINNDDEMSICLFREENNNFNINVSLSTYPINNKIVIDEIIYKLEKIKKKSKKKKKLLINTIALKSQLK